MLKAAEIGDSEAQFWIGYKYMHEEGTEFNDKEMVKWLQKSAAQNNDKGQWLLGIIYIEGKDNGVDVDENKQLGLELLIDSARKGNENAKTKIMQIMEDYNLNADKDSLIAIIEFFRDYTVVDEKTGQLIRYDNTQKEFFVIKDTILNINSEYCDTTLKINKITDIDMEIEIRDSFVYNLDNMDDINKIVVNIKKGDMYEYSLPSEYLLKIKYL